VDNPVVTSSAARHSGELVPRPFVPIVRTLVNARLGSDEFTDAAECAGPDELAFAAEILEHRLKKARQ
jgi:hypothetical protein